MDKADLEERQLDDSILCDCTIKNSNLKLSRLTSAILVGADFSHSDLTRANLEGAVLINSIFVGATLEGVVFLSSDLTGSVFDAANLEDASLNRAELINSSFLEAKLDGAWFGEANMEGVEYQPSSLPVLSDIARARNLDKMRPNRDRSALVQLWKFLKENGYFYAAKQVNAAIRRSSEPGVVDHIVDFTCDYGANVTRPLLFLLGSIPIFSLAYLFFMQSWSKRGDIYKIEEGITQGNERNTRRILLKASTSSPNFAYLYPALVLSLVSCINIGFRDFQTGNWFKLLMPQKFELEPTGIARTISGIQALYGAYLLAIIILSYLGTPFERF